MAKTIGKLIPIGAAVTGLIWLWAAQPGWPSRPTLTVTSACELRDRSALEAVGLTLQPLNAQHRRSYSLPNQLNHGAVVVGITSGSVAASVGLQAGDVILLIDQRRIDTLDDAERYYELGRATPLLIQRRDLIVYSELPAFSCPTSVSAPTSKSSLVRMSF
ncbi:MAG: PDZ domain-containing protein [Myxococcota bacterium]